MLAPGLRLKLWKEKNMGCGLDLISGPEQDLISEPQLSVSHGRLLEGGW